MMLDHSNIPLYFLPSHLLDLNKALDVTALFTSHTFSNKSWPLSPAGVRRMLVNPFLCGRCYQRILYFYTGRLKSALRGGKTEFSGMGCRKIF